MPSGAHGTWAPPPEESPDVTCQRNIGLANDALGKKNLGLASYHLHLALSSATPSTRESVLDVDNRLHKAGEETLDTAMEAYKTGQYIGAMKTYESLVLWMPGSAVAIKAKELLAAGRKDPAVQAALQEIRAKAFYDRAVATVQGRTVPTTQPAGAAIDPREAPITATDVRELPVERQLIVVDTLQTVVNSYPTSQQAEQCRQLLANLDKDPSFRAGIEQYRTSRDARQAYELGHNYQAAGKRQQAIEQYRLACAKCPGSEWARKSMSALAELGTR